MKSKETEEIQGKSFIVYVLYVVLFLSLLGCVWFGYSYFKAQKQIAYLSTAQAQQELVQKEREALINQVKKHIILPQDTPTIATIEDVETLKKDQPFYEGAKNGDKVLVFKDRAVIYNVQNDILVNVGPVYREPEPSQNKEAVVESKKEPLTIEIRNGSKIVGVAQELGVRLGEKKEEFSVTKVSNAQNREYKGTILVNVSGKDVTSLEKELQVKAQAMPESETMSTADVLIILGN